MGRSQTGKFERGPHHSPRTAKSNTQKRVAARAECYVRPGRQRRVRSLSYWRRVLGCMPPPSGVPSGREPVVAAGRGG